MRIGFLFNHDASHQVPHTIPIAAALAMQGVDIEVLASSEEQRSVAQALMPPNTPVKFKSLKIGAASQAADHFLRHVAPFKRIAILRENLDLFRQFDALVVPETTSALLKTRFGVTGPKLIYLPHGAGDGAAGFQPETKSFDLVLLSGRKVRDRMLASGLVTETNHAIVGYPKFDRIGLRPHVKFFDNDRPTVLYNPHFSPALSSWYPVGRGVLEWFATQDRFNLIFAPHVMLFKRLLHTSLIHRKVKIRPHLPKRFHNNTGLLIDVGSSRSIDMSYVQSADIYLGDVSSQIYEWIQSPRPAIFLNTHKPNWREAPEYRHWATGEVIAGLDLLPAVLDRAIDHPDAFRVFQEAAARETFSITDRPAAERAAEAILVFMQKIARRPML